MPAAGNCEQVRRSARRRLTLPALAGAAASRALAGALAIVLAAAAGTAGWSYVWCAPMSEARVHCCCPSPSARSQGSEDVVSRECCDDRSVPSLPTVDAIDAAPKLVAAPLAGLLPLWAWLGALDEGSGEVAPETSARAGPDQRTHASVSVYLI